MSSAGKFNCRRTDPKAQRFFDQGLDLVYGFNFVDAIRSFKRAAELDPECGMAYWGIALAEGPNYNSFRIDADRRKRAFDAIQTALDLSKDVNGPDREYVRALSARFSADPQDDPNALAHDYATAMRGLYRRFPDDPDAAALFAASMMDTNPWQLWTADGKPAPDTSEVVSVLEEGLLRWPRHIGLRNAQ